jgi:spermidine synthase
LLTGFVLIAYLGVNQIFWLTGSLLIALSTLYFLFFRRLWAVALVAIVPFTLMPHEVAVSKIMQDGTHVELISNQDSFYGNIKVVDYSFKEKHVRDMMIDGKAQGGMDMSNGLSLYDYPYFLQFLPYAFYPEGKSCLVIGLGAGLIPAWYQAQGIKTEVVDIDPTVAELARKYFKFNPDIPVHIEDARYFLSNTSQKYDYMIMDAFNGDTTPGHLINVEAIRLAKQRLTPNGVFAVNLIGSINHDTFVTASIIKTLQKVFQQVVIFPAIYPENNGIGNIEVIAYDGPLRALQLERVPKMAIRTDSEKFVRNSLTQTFTFPRQTPAILLSDDFNPVDFYDIWLKELLRKKTIEAIDFDILTS